MSTAKPKGVQRAKSWDDSVEEAYRFQVAGYKDLNEYVEKNPSVEIDRWPHNNYIKKLQRRDGCFYYYNKGRECPDKEVRNIKIYTY